MTGQYITIGEMKGKGCSSTVADVGIITHFFFPPVWYIRSNQAPISPTAVLLVMLLVSWPGRQNDEVSREVIPVCSSDYFPNSHLILATTHQQGGRESVRREVARQGRQRRGEEWKRRGGEGWRGRKQRSTDNGWRHKGKRDNRFSFWEMRRAQWSVLYDQREWLVICPPVHKTVSPPADKNSSCFPIKCTLYLFIYSVT